MFEPERSSLGTDRSFDGKIGDRSREALRAESGRLSRSLSELLAFEDRLLSESLRFDRAILEAKLRSLLFDLDERRIYEREPSAYDAAFAVLPLCLPSETRSRGERAASATLRLAGIPARLQQAKTQAGHPARTALAAALRAARKSLRVF